MTYILSSKTGIKSARILSEVLGIPAYTKPRKSPPVILWGSAVQNLEWNKLTEYNKCELVKIAQNRVDFTNLLSENNIKSIRYYKQVVPEKYPVVVRTLLNSYKGRGIIIAKNEEEYLPYKNYYYSNFIKFDYELRVHMVEGKVIRIFKKMYIPENEENKEDDYPIRNSVNGYHFSLRNKDLYSKVFTIVEEIYKVFPINMLGLDLGYVNGDGYYVIEGNTCPSLNLKTAELYAEVLKKLL